MAKRWHPLTGLLSSSSLSRCFIIGGETPDVDDPVSNATYCRYGTPSRDEPVRRG